MGGKPIYKHSESPGRPPFPRKNELPGLAGQVLRRIGKRTSVLKNKNKKEESGTRRASLPQGTVMAVPLLFYSNPQKSSKKFRSFAKNPNSSYYIVIFTYLNI